MILFLLTLGYLNLTLIFTRCLGGAHQNHPSPTDHVIPPGFTPSDFEFSEKKEDYWLFLGRIVDAKGVHIADQLSRALRQPIKFVGPQTLKTTLPKDNPYAEYIPTVSHEQRKHLLKKAKGLLMPTLYMEPCGWSIDRSLVFRDPGFNHRLGGSC